MKVKSEPLASNAEVPSGCGASVRQRGVRRAASQTMRYILRHIRRAPVRSLLAVLLALILAFALGQFSATRSIYAVLYNNVEITARFMRGLPYSKTKSVEESGYVTGAYYELIAQDKEINQTGVELVIANDLRRLENVEVEFMSGYNRDTVMGLEERVCLLPAELMEEKELELGDTALINKYDAMNTLLKNSPGRTYEEYEELYERSSVRCVVVGRITGDTERSAAYIPVGAERYFKLFYPHGFMLDLAEYTLGSYHDAGAFEQYAHEVINSMRETTALFAMDTSKADSIYKIYSLINTLYPIAMTAALLIGGTLPGLIVLNAAREAAILRVLGTTRRRTRFMLAGEQVILCIAGLMLAAGALAVINGEKLRDIASPVGLYMALHLALCAVGGTVGAVAVTRKKVLELLQVKE